MTDSLWKKTHSRQ